MGAAQSLTPPEFRYGQSYQYFEDLIDTLDFQKGYSMDFSELERELEKRGKELMLKLIQEHINNRSPGKSCEPVKDTDGVERTRTASHERQIETIFGRVELNREG
ncbi:MAG: hypothetical protein K9K21_08340 [Desulfotignum sp.]|nr:hypothetical protein [Desulfotignum sp.]MCF8126472.1 hypothetical protein [Desulfotignum sp.]